MKIKSIRHDSAAHKFVRAYMAAHEVANLNLAKMGQPEWEVNHGHGRRVSELDRRLCHLPLDLTGDKPRQPQGRLTFQPFATMLAK